MNEAALELLLKLKDEATPAVEGLAEKLGGLGPAALAGAGIAAAAIAGIGAAAFDIAGQFDQAEKDIQTQLGATERDAEALGQVVEDVFANNFGESVDDVAQSLIEVKRQLRGVSDAGSVQRATEQALALRDAFGVEVAESTNAANTLMEQFGLTSDQAFAFITSGYQRGLNASDDFLDTIGEYSTQFANGGADAGQFFSLLESGLQGGMLGTDKAADAFKEFRLRIQDGSDATAQALDRLGLGDLYDQLQSGAITAADAFTIVNTKIAELDDPTARMQIGAALIGSQFEDLGDSAVAGLSLAGTSIDDLAGSTASLNTQYDNLGAVGEGATRQLLVAIAPLGDALLGLANEAMPYVVAGAGEIAGWLKENLPGALQATREGVAKLQPLLGALGRLWEALEPAIAGVGWALGQLQGPLGWLFDRFTDGAAQAVNDWAEGIENVASALEDMWRGVDVVKGVLDQIELPWWLTPGSPTPLEHGLRGIADASGEARGDMQGFAGGLDLASPALAAPSRPAAGGAGGGATAISIAALTVQITEPVRDARQLARDLYPALREEAARYAGRNGSNGLA